MSDIIIGIDPGASGGIAWHDGGNVEVFKMPETEKDIFNLIECVSPQCTRRKAFCYLEQVASMPGDSGRSMFTFGMGYGGLRMALIACNIPFEVVKPQVWKKEYKLIFRKKLHQKGMPDSKYKTWIKNQSKAKAQQLFPMFKKITHAHADALLIMEYGRRLRNGM